MKFMMCWFKDEVFFKVVYDVRMENMLQDFGVNCWEGYWMRVVCCIFVFFFKVGDNVGYF